MMTRSLYTLNYFFFHFFEYLHIKRLEGLLFEDILDRVAASPNCRCDRYIVTWIGDFNPQMIRVR